MYNPCPLRKYKYREKTIENVWNVLKSKNMQRICKEKFRPFVWVLINSYYFIKYALTFLLSSFPSQPDKKQNHPFQAILVAKK